LWNICSVLELMCCGNIYSVLERMVKWEHLQCTRTYGVVGTSTVY